MLSFFLVVVNAGCINLEAVLPCLSQPIIQLGIVNRDVMERWEVLWQELLYLMLSWCWDMHFWKLQ